MWFGGTNIIVNLTDIKTSNFLEFKQITNLNLQPKAGLTLTKMHIKEEIRQSLFSGHFYSSFKQYFRPYGEDNNVTTSCLCVKHHSVFLQVGNEHPIERKKDDTKQKRL